MPFRELGRAEVAAREPNAEWACDFKGWFRTRDGTRCDPLTITDTQTRYLVDVHIAEPAVEGVRPVFERAFEEHGLPQAIRSDNGEIKWNGEFVFRSEPLIGETVGLAETPSGANIVRFFEIDLGIIDRQGRFRRFAPLRHRLRYAPEDQPQQKVSGINPV